MRRAANVDDKQAAFVAALRKIGCTVADTSGAGDGFPDLVVGRLGIHGRQNYLIEIKDGSKSPSRRALTPAQVKFHDEWKGQIAVVNSVDEAIEAVTGLKNKTQ